MKTTIFLLLKNPPSEAYAAFEQQLRQIAGGHFDLQMVKTPEVLQLELKKAGQAIVISDVLPPKLSLFMADGLQALANTSFISVVDEPTDFTEAMRSSNCQFLMLPTDDLTLASALVTATRQGSLQGNLMPLGKMDEVDNLLSRSYFMQRISEELSSARRHESPLTCVIISVDFYKMYLDTYGYHFITSLLRFVGEEAKRLIRHEDQVARLGDDELAILVTRCSKPDTTKLIKRLVEQLNTRVFALDEHREEISIHVGVATYPFEDSNPVTPDVVVRYARHALYNSKNSDDDACKVITFNEIAPQI